MHGKGQRSRAVRHSQSEVIVSGNFHARPFLCGRPLTEALGSTFETHPCGGYAYLRIQKRHSRARD